MGGGGVVVEIAGGVEDDGEGRRADGEETREKKEPGEEACEPALEPATAQVFGRKRRGVVHGHPKTRRGCLSGGKAKRVTVYGVKRDDATTRRSIVKGTQLVAVGLTELAAPRPSVDPTHHPLHSFNRALAFSAKLESRGSVVKGMEMALYRKRDCTRFVA